MIDKNIAFIEIRGVTEDTRTWNQLIDIHFITRCQRDIRIREHRINYRNGKFIRKQVPFNSNLDYIENGVDVYIKHSY